MWVYVFMVAFLVGGVLYARLALVRNDHWCLVFALLSILMFFDFGLLFYNVTVVSR